jgi:hypothetical protein
VKNSEDDERKDFGVVKQHISKDRKTENISCERGVFFLGLKMGWFGV